MSGEGLSPDIPSSLPTIRSFLKLHLYSDPYKIPIYKNTRFV